MAGLSKMSTHPLVSSMVNASLRILGRPKVEKDPVTPEIVKSKITDKFLSFCLFLILDQSPMLNWLPGFFRFSELCHIKACEVKFFPLYVFIFLESSKTDQFRIGSWIIIARSDLPTCPVKALKNYITASQIELFEDLPVFKARALATPRSKQKVRSRGISNSRTRELIKEAY